jgi:peptide/nickel transport system substrate-binding protein
MEKKLSRRDFMLAAGITAGATMLAACQPQVVEKIVKETVVVEKEKIVEKQSTVVVEKKVEVQKEVTKIVEKQVGLKNVAREKTLILYFGGSGGTWNRAGIVNPYASPGWTHQEGDSACIEGLQYYSAFADKQMPWMAESHSYNADSTELTIKIRKGVEWSDGKPFTAKDVAFTLNMLAQGAPKLPRNSSLMKTWIKTCTAPDDFTVKIAFNTPQPRFFFDYLTFKFDTGQYIVPEHIYKPIMDKGVDEVMKFTFWDPEKKWPVVTGPYNYTYFTNMQKFLDRRDDWWAAKIGFAKLPEVERILCIPMVDDTKAAQLSIQNAVDACLDLRPNVIKTILDQNPAVIAHSMKSKPYGYIDWWPNNMGFNTTEPPFNTPNMRWAVSYAIDRKQAIDVAYDGAGVPNKLFLPDYKSLKPFLDAVDFVKYPTNEFNLAKSDDLMKKEGWAKDGKGMWTKGGQMCKIEVSGWQIHADIGPVLAEQLRKAGFDAAFAMPADHSDKMARGLKNGFITGHGGSVGPDPFLSAMEYHKVYWAKTGDPAAKSWHWNNDAYSAVIDEMSKVPMGDPKVMELWKKAMDIWCTELPSVPLIQWFHRIPMNQTYWTGWPTQENPYLNGAFWHLTFPRILDQLKAVKK